MLPQDVGEGYRDVYHHQHQDEDRAGVRRAPSFAERIREAETRPAARVSLSYPGVVTTNKPSHFQPRTGDGHLWSYTNPNDKMVPQPIYLSINISIYYLFCVY